jgi:hypothetical protein
MLTTSTLSSLEDRLRAVGVRLDTWTQPGLDPEEIRQRMATLDIRLPDEAVLWWSWRNGETPEGWGKVLPQWQRFASLDDAISTYRRVREIAVNTAPDDPSEDPNELWEPTWFPMSDHKIKLVVDCSVAHGEPTLIRNHGWESMRAENEKVVAASFGDVVSQWCAAIDNGVWEWDARAARWWPHWDRLDDPLLSRLT